MGRGSTIADPALRHKCSRPPIGERSTRSQEQPYDLSNAPRSDAPTTALGRAAGRAAYRGPSTETISAHDTAGFDSYRDSQSGNLFLNACGKHHVLRAIYNAKTEQFLGTSARGVAARSATRRDPRCALWQRRDLQPGVAQDLCSMLGLPGA